MTQQVGEEEQEEEHEHEHEEVAMVVIVLGVFAIISIVEVPRCSGCKPFAEATFNRLCWMQSLGRQLVTSGAAQSESFAQVLECHLQLGAHEA